jgi:hypothetical protein
MIDMIYYIYNFVQHKRQIKNGLTPLTVDCSYWYWSGCPFDGTWYYGIPPWGIFADTDDNGDDEWYAAILDRNYVYVPNICYIYPKYDAPQIVDYTYYQRFVIENYSEPCFVDPVPYVYSAWGSFDLYKGDSGNPLEVPVPGATYLLKYVSGQTYEPSVTEYYLVTDEFGKDSVEGLPWGIYELTEVAPPPAGYLLDPAVYTYNIGGEALFEGSSGTIAASDIVTNDPVPPGDGDGDGDITTVTTTATPTIGVAGIIEVAGLAFTGVNPVIPFGGMGVIASGLGLLVASLIRKRKK